MGIFNKIRKKTVKLLGIYLLVWLAALLVFYLLISPGDAMGYSLVVHWGVLPFATLVISFLLAKNNCGGERRWQWAIFFGVMYMLADYFTFRLRHMLNTGQIDAPMWDMGVNGILISLAGLFVGDWLRRQSPAGRGAASQTDDSGSVLPAEQAGSQGMTKK